MMSKIRSIQDSWLAKGILILTALSFMSLFGISGYLSRSGSNRPIIRVDDIVVFQDEITNKYNTEIQAAKSLFGDNLEVNDNMRNAILQGIVQKELVKAILQKTAEEKNIIISNDLIRKIIFSQAEFMDADGRFNREMFRRMLSASGWTEQRYIDALRQDIEKQHLIQTPASNINMPEFMVKYLAQLENQKKVFKYISINPEDVKTDRKMSNEEMEQYYQDFEAQFVAPEERDVSFIVLSTNDIEANIKPSEAEIEDYYKENINQFVIPEQRNVLQMMFDSQEAADAAFKKLKAGGDFYAVAKEAANQDKAATELGNVAKDTLIAEIADDVFELKNGQYTAPVKSELGWHIMKVIGITPVKETKIGAARAQIIAALRKDKAYEAAYETSTEIEDKIGAGAGLEDIAKDYNVKINQANGLNEDGTVKEVAPQYKAMVTENDFVDTAFSYNAGEVSQVIEADEGFIVARVDQIRDAHTRPMDEVKADIQRMWEISEKNAIAQEIVNDVTHDLENGDSVEDVAKRFNLNYKTTRPLKRNENFGGLSRAQMNELFQEELGVPHLITEGENQMVVVATEALNAVPKLTPGEEKVLRIKGSADLSQTAANTLIDDFGSDYKIRVKYKYIGLAD